MGHLTDARAAIMAVVAQIQTDFTAYPLTVEIDNRNVVNQATQQTPYLCVHVKPLGAEQADMADNPRVIQRGQIILYAVAKDGAGSAQAEALLDFITPYFDLKTLGTVHCRAVEAQTQKSIQGWWYAPAIVNYWYHRASS